jgi:hypothetical protein
MLRQGTTFIFPTSRKTLACLIGIFSIGALFAVVSSIVGMIALILSTGFLLQLMLHTFVEVCAYADTSNILTQILLIIVLGFILYKLYTLAGRGLYTFFKRAEA